MAENSRTEEKAKKKEVWKDLIHDWQEIRFNFL